MQPQEHFLSEDDPIEADENVPADAEVAFTIDATDDRPLHCFHCHRPENHFHGLRRYWYFSVLLGFSFGLLLVLGPFRCRCCGTARYFYHDKLNPRFWLTKLSVPRRRRRSRSRK